MKRILKWAGMAIVGLLCVIAFNTIRYTPTKAAYVETSVPQVDADIVAQKLSEAIQFRTVSHPVDTLGRPEAYQEFIHWLGGAFPNASGAMERTIVAYYLAALEQGLPMPRIAAYQQATTADMVVEPFNLNDQLWMAGVKIHADGSPFIGNIWLTTPYLETPMTLERMDLKPGHTGGPIYPQAYFEDMVRTYVAQGWQMTIYTQGDRTIDMVLDLLSNIFAEKTYPDHRFRLEHCALMRTDQVIRAQEMGVLCSFLINHITNWGVPIEDHLFGPERAAHYMPAGTADPAGMRISLHADTPMTDPSALELMQAATTRRAGD
jgi:predicted amidohydrolase YtcJ